MPAVVSPCDL